MGGSPYDVNWRPLHELGNELFQREQLRNKLAMEQERLGFERALHPGALAAQQEAIRHAGATNPLTEQQLREAIAQTGRTNPLHVRGLTAETIGKEEALAAQQRFRADPYGDNPPPNAATARIPQSQYAPATPGPATPAVPGAAKGAAPIQWYAPAPGSRAADAPAQAAQVAQFVEDHVLKVSDTDPGSAKGQWEQFKADPAIAPRWQQHVQAYGAQSGNWVREASDFVRDMRHEANGNVLHPWGSGADARLAPAQAPQAATQAAATSAAPQAPAQQASAPQTAAAAPGTPQQMAALAALNRDKRLYQNMIRNGVNVAAAETGLKNIHEQEKMGQYNVPNVGMVSLPGFAENQARTKGLEKEAEAQQANYEKANQAVAESHALARKARELRALAPQSIVGSGAEWELAARKIASRLGHVDPRIAPSELLKSALTQFVSAEAQKLKPVSASDIAFVQQSIGGLSSDPSSLPHIAAAWDTAAQRQELYHELESQSYLQDIPALGSRKGYPNRSAILAYVDQKIPSYVESMLGGQGTPDSKAAPKDAAAAATPDAPATKEALLGAPDGPVFGGKYIKRGTQLFPVYGEPGTVGNPHAKRTDVTDYGQYAFENGKLYKRTPNLIADRWEEVLPPATTQRGPQ